jgi:hypothetical protein
MTVNKRISGGLIVAALLSISSSVYAEAGRVVFVYGDVTAESSDGEVRRLTKRSQVEPGDIIRTSGKSLVQMRMIDKAFIALRANSEFKIEAYQLGATKEEDQGIFSLLRGGFRAVTGIIGKRLRSAYKMRTVNATIGIRGTDYSARLCNNDCSQAFGNLTEGARIDDGLYVGVNDGGIDLTNDLGAINLDELQFGYVKDATTAPVALASAPEFLYFNSRPPDPEEDQLARSDDSADTATDTQARNESTVEARAEVEPEAADLSNSETVKQDVQADQVEVSQHQIDQTITREIEAVSGDGSAIPLSDGNVGRLRMITNSFGNAGQGGSVAAVQSNPLTAFTVGANRDLSRFAGQSTSGAGTLSQGSANNIELGFDPVTGIAWGRWNAGSIQFQNASGTQNLDFSNNSMHWVAGPERSPNIALPSTGTASYSLVGNTTPTDNFGNAGLLGTAELSANFTNRTVDAGVALGINNQVWNGAANGMRIDRNGGFSGGMNVTIDGAPIGQTGRAAGFFTNNGNGAGMGYSLQNGATSVSGTAIFQKN